MPVDIFRVTVADLIGESPLGLPTACLQPFYRCHALFYHGITKYQNAGSADATRTVHPFPQVNDVLTATDYHSAQSSIRCRREELNTVYLTMVKTLSLSCDSIILKCIQFWKSYFARPEYENILCAENIYCDYRQLL